MATGGRHATRIARNGRAGRPAGRVRAKRTPDTRARILSAAAIEFSDRGFAGAGIDRIARRARVNKAMIYYHFTSKQALYEVVLGELYIAVRERLSTAAARSGTPGEKIDAFVEALAEEVKARPHFLPMMLREMAQGGPHLGRPTFELIGSIFQLVRAIVAEGTGAGVFRPIDPVLAVVTIIGPTVVFHASAPVRARIGRLGIADISMHDSIAFVRHLQTVTRRMLSQ
jgi:TetR/AcrR family transcriptional regulator